MEQNIKQLLQNTLNPNANIRNEAERQLKIVAKNPEMMFLIHTVIMKDPNPLMKQIASIFFANSLRQNWKAPELALFIESLEEQMLGLLMVEDRYPRQCYLDILQLIFDDSQNTEQVEKLFKKCSLYLASSDRGENKAALVLIDGVFKSDSLRYNLESILSMIFNESGPIFTQRFSDALVNKDYEIAKIHMKIVARAYTHYSIPDYLNTLQVFENFFNIALQILKLEFSNDEYLSKLKKWALFFLQKASNKGFKKYYKNAEFIDFVKKDTNLNHLILAFFGIVGDFSEGKVFHRTALVYTCEFFILLAQTKDTKPIVRDNCSVLLNKFILPAQSFNDELQESFECDGEKYLRERYNYVSNDLRSGTSSLFTDIIHIEKSLKSTIISNLIASLDNKAMPNYNSYRYGVIGLLAAEQKNIQKLFGKSGFEGFVCKQICMDLHSEHEFLVSQALYFLSLSEESQFDANASLAALNRVLELMNSDSEILSVEAALAMSFFIGNPLLSDTMKSLVPMLLEKVILFSKQHLLESLNSLMDSIIDNYTDAVATFAPQFATSICNNILEHLESKDEARIPTVSGFITTIDKLIINADSQLDIVRKIYSSAYKVIYTIFFKQIDAFYQEAFDLMNSFLFTLQAIDENMLVILGLALSIDKEELSFYPREVNDFVDNFLSYGKGAIINNQILEKIYNCIDAYIPSVEPEDDIYDEDFEAGCRIADSLMLNAGSAVHALNPHIIPCLVHKIIINYDQANNNSYLDVLGLETIMNCFLVSPEVVLESLGPFLSQFFSEMYLKKSKFVRVHDKKVFILFIGTLFKMNTGLQCNIENINDAFVETLYSLPEAIKKRNKLKEKEDAEEFSDENENEDADDEEYEEEDDNYDFLTEDIWFETDLDKFDAYEFVRGLLSSPIPKSIGEVAISKMTEPQILKIKEILSVKQEAQK